MKKWMISTGAVVVGVAALGAAAAFSLGGGGDVAEEGLPIDGGPGLAAACLPTHPDCEDSSTDGPLLEPGDPAAPSEGDLDEASLPVYDGPALDEEAANEGPILEPGDTAAPGSADGQPISAGMCAEGYTDCTDTVSIENPGDVTAVEESMPGR